VRVLQVSHTAEPGGSNSVLLSLIRHAPADVHNACVFLEGGPVAQEARDLGASAAVVPTGRAREFWRAPGAVRRLRAAIRDERADVVLAHVNKAHLYAGVAAKLERVPCAWWQHEHLDLKPRLQRVASRVPAAAVICSAEWIAEQQRRHTRAPVHVVHPGVEPAALAAPAREHRTGPADPVVIGVVGRLARWKRAQLAVRAMPAVRESIPAARLRIVGGPGVEADRGFAEDLEAEVTRLGLGDAVELVGHVADAGEAIRGLDVLAHPAEREPWGIVVLEAMAAGVPVVAAADGGPREIVRDGEDGLLLDPVDTPAFAGALVRLGGDPALRSRMGAAGRERVEGGFRAESAARRLWELIGAEVAGTDLSWRGEGA